MHNATQYKKIAFLSRNKKLIFCAVKQKEKNKKRKAHRITFIYFPT